jgi:hypothetical protein
MDYIAPLNRPATVDDPRPAYFDGNAQTGQEGSYPSGKSLENPMRELLAVIEGAGIAPNNSDLTQVLQAINKLIATALENYSPPGGGGPAPIPASFLLNPIYPHVTVNGGVMSVASANAQVSIAAGQTFIHRGGVSYNSSDTAAAQRTFSTVANKTYHLRWRYNGGTPIYRLLDLADATYNAGGLAETHASFDSTFDDMLIARVVTDAANNPTVTALLNKHSLASTDLIVGTEPVQSGKESANFRFKKTLNWARSPATYSLALAMLRWNDASDIDFNIFAYGLPRTSPGSNPVSIPINRYGLDSVVMHDFATELTLQLTCGA